jgi:hypothetical protein
MTWMHKTRLRVLGLVVGLVFAAIGMISLASLPTWPVVGVTVATIAFVVNKMTTRLSHPTCWGCGGSIAHLEPGQYGVECPSCGTLTPSGAVLGWTVQESADQDQA